jgi:SAM-dependent methyltransferase
METHHQSSDVSPFWMDPETVEIFASRDPDLRLVEILDNWAEPNDPQVLDLGCAGGRNTVLLAERGFDFQALDASRPMVTKTRERVSSIRGTAAAQQRVHFGAMEDLGAFPDASFNFVIALGVYHQASSLRQWHDAVEESARVLIDGGLVLVSGFTPDSQPEGRPLAPESDSRDMYAGFSSGPLCLFGKDDHDREMATHGFEPEVSTETVNVKTELGYRVTLNALYRMRGPR